MKTVWLNAHSYPVPQAWHECTSRQIVALLPLTLVPLELLEPQERTVLKARALAELMPIPKKTAQQLTVEQRYRLGQLTLWIWKERLQHKPLDWFEVDGVRYHLPDPHYSNTSAIEIAMANMHYLAYTRPENPNSMAVYALIATLCRPVRKDAETFRQSADWNGDLREEFNSVLADERARKFQKLSIGQVMAVLKYFEWMNNRFFESYQDVYDSDESDEPPLYKNGEGILTSLMDIAKLGVFGNFDQVCKQNVHTVWIFLRDNNLKIKRETKLMEKEIESYRDSQSC
ncbi:hypothetical protein [Larkinella humicola]|uniref:Uncharacterized protein n=1 Tax=Larkinella humicola TaxID=2607654 RepID=A0A5N1JBS6_9BACT|nr:hypothetical protein [Larkinella humicola]KAA9346319.1 hypothetical protein F0P93_29060 [Larkinella humicola]